MHPTPEEIARFADNEAPYDVAARLVPHFAVCAPCLRELARQRVLASEFSVAVQSVGGPPPAITATEVIARARRRQTHQARGRRRYPGTAVAAGVLLAVATVAAAMPQSPVRRYLERLFSSRISARAIPSLTNPASPAPRPQDAATPSGMSFQPRREASIVFRDSPPAAVIRIHLVDGAAVTVTGTGGARRYALRGDTVTIVSGGDGTFDIAVPSDVARVSVQADGRVVFSKSGATITTSAHRDTTGAWVISFAPGSRSIP